MNAITVTREYGAGGYEVAARLAELLGWELLDRNLLHQAAAVEHLPDAELERLDEKAGSLADRFRLHPPHERYIHGLTEAARQAVARGNVVLVGRGTGQLLADDANVFHLRLTASREWRARRMAQREGWSQEEALARCTREDHDRDRFTRYFFGDAPFHLAAYHAVFNTGWTPLEDVTVCVAAVVKADPHPSAPSPSRCREPSGTDGPARLAGPTVGEGGRVLTLARELGGGESDFAAALGARLGLKVYDRELLEREAVRLGIRDADLERIDEHAAGIFQRFWPGSLHQRYFAVLGQLLRDLADRGDALVVGRGGARLLRDRPGVFHVRLTATLDVRVRRVMEHRWVREEVAKQLIAASDAQRRQFYESHFGADWADPLEYHIAVNSGRLGPAAVDLVALAAGLFWGRG